MTQPDVDVDVAVVGAGLAGLACARATSAAGLNTVVLEASDGVGGRVRTDEVDGFLLDRGFQILLTGYPEVASALDVGSLDLHAFDPGSRVWTGSSFQRVTDPFRQPAGLLDTVRADVGSWRDKLRIARLRRRLVAADPRDLLRSPDRTTLDALRGEGFSERIIERFFRPLLGGIQLDAELGGSARMAELIFRTLAVGDAAVPARGMQAIPAQIAEQLPAGTVRLGQAVSQLDGTTVVLAGGERIAARSVVIATEGPAASRLLGLPDPGSRPVSALWFVAAEAPLPGRSILLDGARTGPALNVAVMSEVAPSYAPDHRTLVVAGCPGPEVPDLEVEVRFQLRGWFGSVVDGWELLRRDDIAHGQPLAAPSFGPKQPVALGAGRFVTGDHRDTPSIQGALFSGRRCGQAVVASLGRR